MKVTPKKKYSPPKLTRFGTVEEMTKNVGTKGTPDGNPFPHNKTG